MALTQVAGGMIASSQTITSPTLTTPVVSTTMGVGGATPAASGSGITFPATQSASSDANTLDDYEEGAWTPQVTIGGSNVSTSMSDVRYTKIGRVVCIAGMVNFASGTGTGSIKVTGLPFASSGTNFFRGISVNDYFTNPQQYYLYVGNAATQIELRVMGTSTSNGSRDLAGTDVLSNTTLSMYFGFVYYTT